MGYLPYFSKNKYYSSGLATGTSANDEHNLHFVYKIDFGMGKEDTSNVVSFRELSSKKLEVHLLRELNDSSGFGRGFAGLQGKTGTIQVVYETASLMTTQSSTGRVNLSLNN